MIVGSVIGSGIFLVPARVAQNVPEIGLIVVAWVLGGLFSLAGALTLAELGAMLPHAGGPYVYLKEAFGPAVGFLFGWTEFLVIRAGSVATLAAACLLMFSMLRNTLFESIAGLGLILLGLPAYWLFFRSDQPPSERRNPEQLGGC